jgi:hypoxanthine-guanine phosphoribosyltransferase
MVTAALKRVKATVQQVGLSRSERAANVQGAFRVPEQGKAAVAGRRLIVLDDVLISGATVEGCAPGAAARRREKRRRAGLRQGCRSNPDIHITD